MSTRKGDELFESAAAKLEHASDRAAASEGVTAKLAGPLAEDAHFLRKLKPSLVAARVRGRRVATGGEPRRAPSGPQLGPRQATGQAGPHPLVVVGAAFVLGMLVAKVVDWRSHAHPRG